MYKKLTLALFCLVIILLQVIQAFAVPVTTSYTYDDLYRLTLVSRADGTSIAYQYDENGNRTKRKISLSSSNDTTAPVISTFTAPSTSSSLAVTGINLTATDVVGVTGYMLTESSTKPLASNAGWVFPAPTNYTFTSTGPKTLYAWAKDGAGNISASMFASITITQLTSVDGACGSSNGGTFTAAPATNLCSAGIASSVTGTGPWTWICQGQNGGTSANCSANVTTTPPVGGAFPLKTVGGAVLDQSGALFQIKSINFDHYKSYSYEKAGYPGNSNKPISIAEFLERLKWSHNRDDYFRVANKGFNTVRLNICPDHVIDMSSASPQPYTGSDNPFENLKQQVAWAKEAGVALVIAVHAPPGSVYAGGAFDDLPFWQSMGYDPSAPGIFNKNSSKYLSLEKVWKQLATAFGSESHVLFEILAKPQLNSAFGTAIYSSFIGEIASSIRAISPGKLLVIDLLDHAVPKPHNLKFAKSLLLAVPQLQTNTMFSFQFDRPEAFVYQGCSWNSALCDLLSGKTIQLDKTLPSDTRVMELPFKVADFSEQITDPVLNVTCASQPGGCLFSKIDIRDASNGAVVYSTTFESLAADSNVNKPAPEIAGRLKGTGLPSWTTVSNTQWASTAGSLISLFNGTAAAYLRIDKTCNPDDSNQWASAYQFDYDTPQKVIFLDPAKSYLLRVSFKGESFAHYGTVDISLMNIRPSDDIHRDVWKKTITMNQPSNSNEVQFNLSSDFDMVEGDLRAIKAYATELNVPLLLGDASYPQRSAERKQYFDYLKQVAESKGIGWGMSVYRDTLSATAVCDAARGKTCGQYRMFGLFSGWGKTVTEMLDSGSMGSSINTDEFYYDSEFWGALGAIYKPFPLSLAMSGTGTGSITPSSGTISWTGTGGVASYLPGSTVTLTASAANLSSFTGWSGCDSVGGPNNTVCTVTMNGSRNITATFDSSYRTLSVTILGSGTGAVNSIPSDIACDFPPLSGKCISIQPFGSSVDLVAISGASSLFNGWSNGCSDCGSSLNCTVTFDINKTCIATFTKTMRAMIGAIYYATIWDAYLSAATSSVIKALTDAYSGSITFNRPVSVVLRGGYDAAYAGQTGMTTIIGTVTVGNGSMVFDRVVIE